MYQVKVNGNWEFAVDRQKEQFSLDGTQLPLDIVSTGNDSFHVLQDGQSYRVQVIEANAEEKKVVIRVNGNEYTLDVKDRYDLLLKQLGISNMATSKVNDIKAPMPGLVFKIVVAEGQTITKGEPVLILEAMKMENVLKSPGDGVVKSIKVQIGAAVEKGQVLVVLE